MLLVNPQSSFTWTEPLDVWGVPMRGTPEKQGHSFSAHGWRAAQEAPTLDADAIGKTVRQALRPLSRPTLNRARAEYASRSVYDYPRYFIIEPTAFCNKACPFCPLTTGVVRKDADGAQRTTMRYSDYMKLMFELAGHDANVYGLSLYGLGESLLWRDPGGYSIVELARAARHVGGFKAINVSTNGDVSNLAELLVADVDDIIISIDGTTSEVYLENRPSTKANDPGAFERTLQRVRTFLQAKADRGSLKPFTRLQIINKGNTKAQVLDFIKQWIATPGVDDVFVKHLDSMTPWVGDAAVPQAESALKMAAVRHMPCQHLYSVGFMNSAGQFTACCHDSRAELADHQSWITTSSFKDWWTGPFMTALRQEHETGATRLPCAACEERDPWLG